MLLNYFGKADRTLNSVLLLAVTTYHLKAMNYGCIHVVLQLC